jgi:predicted RNase H-like nuclease (RuvC/YqgF family)
MSLSFKNVIVASLSLAGIVAGATWTISLQFNDNRRETIRSYENAERWKVPDAIAKMAKLSSTLSEKLTAIKDHEDLKAFKESAETELKNKDIAVSKLSAELGNEIKALKAQLTEAHSKVTALEKELRNLTGEIVYIAEGQALPVGHRALKVGVKDITYHDKYASIYSGDFDSSFMYIGQNFKRDLDDKTYVVTLVSIKADQCGFSFDIVNKKRP